MNENLVEPPGRRPAQKHIEMSTFYNSLDEKQKAMVTLVVNESVEFAVWQNKSNVTKVEQ